MRKKGIVKRVISVILAVSLITSSGALGVLAQESIPEETTVMELAAEDEPEVTAEPEAAAEPAAVVEPEVMAEPETIDESAEIIAEDAADEIEIPVSEEAAEETAVVEDAAAEEAVMAEGTADAGEAAVEDTGSEAEAVPVVEEDPDGVLVLSVDSVDEVPVELLDEEPAVIEDEDEVVYGTMTMSYKEFYDGLAGVDVDAVSSATTSYSSSFSHADTGEVEGSEYMINGVKNVPVEVYPGASDELKARVTPLEEDESYGQYWIVDENGITANLNVVATVYTADPVLEINSHWADYELEVNETDTSYIRKTRSDEGFEVNSQLLGVVIGTEEDTSYGLWHLKNFWLQPYLIGFNAEDENVAGIVGKTINSVTYIMENGSYVYEFSDGIYVKPAYSGETPTGEFNDDATEFTLNDIPAGLDNPVLSITYSTGSSYHKTTVTLLETSLEGAADGDAFSLDEAMPDGIVPTVQILSDNYAQIDVSYPMFDFQRTELEELVEEGLAILDEQAVDGYNYDMLAEHVAEAQDILANGDAYEAEDIIDELGELIEAYKDALPEETETESETETETETEAKQTEQPSTKETEATQTEAQQTEKPSTTETEAKQTEEPSTKETEAVTTSTPLLLLKGTSTKKTVTLTWNKVKKADGYIIYGAECGSKFEKIGTVSGRKNTTWTQKKLNPSSSYKFRVKAYKEVNGKKKILLKSNTAHLQTRGGKYTNVSKVKVSEKEVTLGVGEKQKIKVKTKLVNEKKKLKKHMDTITYLSSDTSVAKVSKKGRITAVGKGNCYVYAIAASGARKKITVTVN